MIRATGLVLLLAAGATASSLAADRSEFNARCGDVDCRVETQPAPWQLLGVGLDLRLLTLAYETGGCWRGHPQVTITKTASGIRIAVDEERIVAADTPDGRLPCTDDVQSGILHVPLRRRIAGRRISGGPRMGSDRTTPSRVPRVLDLWSGDAARALRLQGFRVRHVGRRIGTVAFQSPLPEKRVSGRTVRLTVGRDLFRPRALERCLERGGIPTHPRIPKPGDADAPDLVLWLRHPSAMASVGFYADPARARELPPSSEGTCSGSLECSSAGVT